MAKGSWVRKRFWGLMVGAVTTCLTLVAYSAGWLAPLERYHLDWSFRHCNRITANPRIVLVDINDFALQHIHRWPWPRRMQADLVDVLHECGAEAILLDLVYTEPTPGRIVHPALDPDRTTDPRGQVLGNVTFQDAVYDDKELADAIERAGNVYVAMFFPIFAPQHDPYQQRRAVRKALEENPRISAEATARKLGIINPEDARELWIAARVGAALRDDFALNANELAAKLNLSASEIEKNLSHLKESIARELVDDVLRQNPETDFSDVLRKFLPHQAVDEDSSPRSDLRRAYRHARSRCYLERDALPLVDTLRGRLARGGPASLPLEQIASAAKRIGFVNFENDADGVLRRVPPAANLDGHVVFQIAFALAMDALNLDHTTLTVDREGALRISASDGSRPRRLPLDDRGEVLLNWHLDAGSREWQDSFHHVPVSRVMEVAINRRTMEENESRLALWRGEAVALMFDGAESAYLDYEQAVRRLADTENNSETRAAIEAQIAATETRALTHLKRMGHEIEGLTPEDENERTLFERIENLHRILVVDDLATHIATDNTKLRARNETLLVELRTRVAGKLCFVGHTAAALADMVNTPVYDNMPGVMAHANFVNMLLADRIPTAAPRGLVALLILASGMVVTLLTSSRSPWVTLISMLGLIALLGAASTFFMLRYGYFVGTIVPAGLVFVTWALITLYRQLTEQRQRRSFARELSRNTSPAIAARITEQLDDLDLAPQPAEVTCYFSDLQGFTEISERLGVEQTQTLLNRYLGAMGEVLLKRGAFNKFMGDGIFGFFNAPIWPQAEHAQMGCESALVTQERLTELKRTANEAYREVFANLRMRVGLHTGPVFVGYFGSEHQTDYTCIGDTVNLAARLESANKAFGTRILVSGSCQQIVANHYAFRFLGALQVKGKAQAVDVYELLGRTGEVEDAQLNYAKTFAEAITAFQQRNWPQAKSNFEQCQSEAPEDAAIALYLAQLNVFTQSPPPDNWNQAIELTSK